LGTGKKGNACLASKGLKGCRAVICPSNLKKEKEKTPPTKKDARPVQITGAVKSTVRNTGSAVG